MNAPNSTATANTTTRPTASHTTTPVALPGPTLHPTLSSADYCSPAVFAEEQAKIFHAGWWYACHVDSLPAGHRTVVDVAGESVIVARDVDGSLHAYANVCRHRGAQLCDPDPEGCATKGAIRCTYHAWTYGLDGALRATPRVEDEGLDRSQLSLWPRHVGEHNGLIFVSIADEPLPLEAYLRKHAEWLFTFDTIPFGKLKVGSRTRSVVKSNWKILIENYQECLHCAVVHPELVELLPLYRTGAVIDPDRTDGGVELVNGNNSFTADGTSDLSLLPGMSDDDAKLYRGASVFPNVLVDVTGTSASLTAMYPVGPDTTVIVAEYLFSPEDFEAEGFDPSEIVAFNELVGHQDYEVCERVQRGVASRAFTSGVLTEKDSLVVDFVNHYRATLADG